MIYDLGGSSSICLPPRFHPQRSLFPRIAADGTRQTRWNPDAIADFARAHYTYSNSHKLPLPESRIYSSMHDFPPSVFSLYVVSCCSPSLLRQNHRSSVAVLTLVNLDILFNYRVGITRHISIFILSNKRIILTTVSFQY